MKIARKKKKVEDSSMEKYIKRMRGAITMTSIGFIVIGLLLILKPASTLALISYVLGVICLFIGIVNVIKYFTNKNQDNLMDFGLVLGITCAFFGCIFLFIPEFVASIVPFILGIIIISNSVVRLQFSLNLRRYPNISWIRSFIASIISLFFGIVLLFNPFQGAVVITQIIGVIMILYAISDIIEFHTMNKVLEDGVEFIK